MQELQAILEQRLAGAGKVAVLGVGSSLRGDDAVGLLAASLLGQMLERTPAAERARTFDGGVAPENVTAQIRAFAPTHVVIVDAADMGLQPGECALVPHDAPNANISGGTHGLPLGMVAAYLRETMSCETIIVGIQPATRAFGASPSDSVATAARALAGILLSVLQPSG
jgi:hydrogenase 3 maturation protease